jgi:hypothetical protein
MRVILRLLTILLVATARAAVTPTPGPALEVMSTTTPPKIDGVLDDPAWRGAAHSDAFRQVSPQENVAPTERTEFWVTYDADAVYVAIRCHDAGGAGSIRAWSMQRDQDNGSDDVVRIVFDTFHRQSDGYYFGLTAAGGKHDGLVQNKNEGNDQWDGLWFGRVTRDATGWSAEFAIPVKSLAFDPGNATWGFNVMRSIRRKQELVRWSGFSRAKSNLSLPDAGELRGIAGLRQGRGFDFKPYASINRHSDPAPDEKRFEFNPGFDLVWHVTPRLAATLTVNTDFADAEVDERQVNLGRFPLFFPEKRAFFTQDASLFTFGGIDSDPLPFFSRRIGLADDGTKVDLLGGVKLTGRTGPWTVGLLDVQIAEHAGVASKNLLVGRAALQVLAESSAGIVFTRGDPRINGENSLVGADFNYTNNHVAGDRVLTASASLQYTDSDYARGQGGAGVLKVRYPNEPYAANLWVQRIGNNYDPALGFVSRTGVNQVATWHRYRWNFKDRLVNNVDLSVETNVFTDLHGRLLERGYWYPEIEIDTTRGDYAYFHYQDHREVLDVPFAIRPNVIIPAGRYDWSAPRVIAGTTKSRAVDVRFDVQTGGFYGGKQHSFQTNVGWRPSSHLEFALNGTLRQIRLPQGRFDLRLGEARATYTFSPDLQLSLLAQYDNFSHELGTNFRVKWTVKPGDEIFLIVNQGYDTFAERFRPTQNDTSLKGAWTLRF